MRKLITFCMASISIILAMLVRAAEEPQEDPAVAAARKRQASIKTLDVKFKHIETYAKGAVSDASRFNPNPPTPVPPEDMTVESINRIVIDGEKIRLEDNHPGWYDRGKDTYKRSRLSTFDGRTGQFLIESDYSGKKAMMGGITNEVPWDVDMPSLIPFFMSVCGLNKAFSPRTLGRLRPTGKIEKIGENSCERYTLTGNGGSRMESWLDPKSDYCSVRIRQESNGKVIWLCDIVNSGDEMHGWLPHSWVYQENSWKGKLFVTHKIEIVEMKINEPQPAEIFIVQFPAGCRVQDQRTRPIMDYVAEPDGSLREFDFASDAPPPTRKSWYPPTIWLASAFGLILLVVLAIVIVRRSSAR
ncbi:MAG TPA: hypothetical protein VGZ47_22560 [Gemmataceae bacterium]|jgi:hypothetical protein|nr:hypothetical protein [Gemmataceae bacterium]